MLSKRGEGGGQEASILHQKKRLRVGVTNLPLVIHLEDEKAFGHPNKRDFSTFLAISKSGQTHVQYLI